jgi:hypothetical protein
MFEQQEVVSMQINGVRELFSRFITRSANPKGEMFAKIEKMFEKIAKNL